MVDRCQAEGPGGAGDDPPAAAGAAVAGPVPERPGVLAVVTVVAGALAAGRGAVVAVVAGGVAPAAGCDPPAPDGWTKTWVT